MSKNDESEPATADDNINATDDTEAVDMLEKSEREDHIRRRFAANNNGNANSNTANNDNNDSNKNNATSVAASETSGDGAAAEKPEQKKKKKRDIFDVSFYSYYLLVTLGIVHQIMNHFISFSLIYLRYSATSQCCHHPRQLCP